ncbi:MAG: hypothetical protein HGA47_07610, partial [Zoogloea sp.]|nr:hypothetical protein [Zoogloea sp.]
MRKMPVLMSILLASLVVAACGKKEEPKTETPAPAAVAPAPSAPAAAPAAESANAVGEGVFKKTCVMCHQYESLIGEAEDASRVSLTVTNQVYGQSVHGQA